MSFQVGDTIGDYEIIGVLGEGGMGKVFKVRNLISDRIEALKILLPNLRDNPDLAERFMREIKVQASLVHPNIASLYTAVRIDNQLLMLIEMVEGVTLEEKAKDGPLRPDEGLDYLCQVLSALSYAHERGVIHRDIKPANVVVTPAGVVKMLDFGIAKAAANRKLTVTGTGLGSLYYMSPEQVRGKPADSRSDLYSTGVTAYEILTGQKPFDGDTEYTVMTAHLQHDPDPLEKLNPALPPTLTPAIMKALAKKSADRYQNAEEFRLALKALREGSVKPAPVTQPAAGGKKTMAWAAGVAALAVVGAIGYSVTGQSKQPEPKFVEKQMPAPVATVETPPPVPVATSAPVAAPVQTPAPSRPPEQKEPPRKFVPEPNRPSPAPAAAVLTEPPPPLAPPVAAAAPIVPPAIKLPDNPPPAVADPSRIERADWESVQNSKDVNALRAFRAKHPNGAHAVAATAEIDRLGRETNVKGVLDALQRFRAAYESQDVDAIRGVWPTRGRDELEKIRQGFQMTKSTKLTLQPTADPQITGDTASVTVRRSLIVHLKDGSRPRPVEDQLTFRLRQAGAAWTIVSMQ